MDILVRYWSSKNRIASVYVTSVFMAHGRLDDMMEHFMSATNELDLGKALQVSMDGPNVNWACYQQLQKKVKMIYNAQRLNIGSCGLHVVVWMPASGTRARHCS